MLGFSYFLSTIFVFQDPKLECFNTENKLHFRCSVAQGCNHYSSNYSIDMKASLNSFISSYDNMLCDVKNLNKKQLFTIISAIVILSQVITGLLIDKVGRKKVIVGKAWLSLIFSLTLVILGFINKPLESVVLTIFFTLLFCSTFSFDLILHGFEKLPKQRRESYIVALSATKFVGIGLICIEFYFLNRWVYFFLIQSVMLLICILIYMKFTLESPHHILASTGSIDYCKAILNNIAKVNDEDIVTDKIACGLTPT